MNQDAVERVILENNPINTDRKFQTVIYTMIEYLRTLTDKFLNENLDIEDELYYLQLIFSEILDMIIKIRDTDYKHEDIPETDYKYVDKLFDLMIYLPMVHPEEVVYDNKDRRRLVPYFNPPEIIPLFLRLIVYLQFYRMYMDAVYNAEGTLMPEYEHWLLNHLEMMLATYAKDYAREMGITFTYTSGNQDNTQELFTLADALIIFNEAFELTLETLTNKEYIDMKIFYDNILRSQLNNIKKDLRSRFILIIFGPSGER